MADAFWHEFITEKSFRVLQELRKKYDFVLIGGWAVFLYTKQLKSKDIDIVVGAETLGRLKKDFDVVKNERLQKYEIKMEGFDVDIYVAFWSQLGLSLDYILQNSVSIEGFKVPTKEILLCLKIYTYSQRKSNLKGQKDKIDIISLLYFDGVDFNNLRDILEKFSFGNLLLELKELLNSAAETEELGLNKKQYADFKKRILKRI
ncbi:hypothetical protein A2926_04665 [Candidatus Giovannonibacteria bacterium RIFCSPLOWO2_01_FULL_44_40]|uniref:Uncharacterized protein n=1 Tax=Candidatus Giovannonibacteria bacterium RIFCSPHIGHO2_01_FULL_45_23 TaxID=1798325 RepID=A0A1F5VHS3_9BACT|nr:MAG: hypothetical protein A2834_03110 [Candidatus Giovannonibacteria bacterium RIFCSPHIGHO2_01_FULL_45_23]OGF75621.1 MAG: hypothetical protein A3C77_00970 [Candidatus Giovannonibacteria bacterium RIFCSPHIGHO2_02_FULL_45_13]OGF80128.1 MAG: hypothetical protein A2926_04665 [Candidatus Giovannonibacteria bacterium RIFCSPLOWO2_01_FULL_44_40]